MDHAVLETDRHRYVVVSPLAEGGMGAIFLGRRITASKHARPGSGGSVAADVVLKQLLPEHSADPKLIEMFLREARVSASLDHPNIVRTLDLVNAGDDYYIVMEYVRGGDLRTILRRARRRQKRLSVESALYIASEILNGLAYAHGKRTQDGRSLGLVHRDVTPSNILLGSDGTVKLTDFGIAKAPSQGSVMFKVKGKLGYMSPEQSRGDPVDVRTDIFSVGAVLWESLVGERLFVAAAAQASGIFSQSVRAPSKKRPEIGAEIDAVVLRALSLDPAGRFASAAEFRSALLRAAERDERTLNREVLAADLRTACGEESASWLSPDAPTTLPALDAAGRAEGTGVIEMGSDGSDDPDEPYDDPYDDDDFGSSPSRVTRLPSRELTSIVQFTEESAPHERLEPTPEKYIDRLAFTRTDFAQPAPPVDPPARQEDPQEDDDDGTRTLVHDSAASISQRGRAPSAASSMASANVSRARFDPPVPRPVVQPPSLNDLNQPSASPLPLPGASQAAQSTQPRLELDPTQVRAAVPGHRGVSPATPDRLGDRVVGDRPLVRRMIVVAALLVLIGLGIGLGLLLSGPSADEIPTGSTPSTR